MSLGSSYLCERLVRFFLSLTSQVQEPQLLEGLALVGGHRRDGGTEMLNRTVLNKSTHDVFFCAKAP